jgi:prolipoprotein diacylglyceryltransferase
MNPTDSKKSGPIRTLDIVNGLICVLLFVLTVGFLAASLELDRLAFHLDYVTYHQWHEPLDDARLWWSGFCFQGAILSGVAYALFWTISSAVRASNVRTWAAARRSDQ